MTLGAMGDTHGNRALMHRAAKQMTRVCRAEVIIHLGDDYGDAEQLARAGYDVRMVPGLWCPEHANALVPNRQFEAIDGVTVAFAHAEKDLQASDRSAAVIIIGHTHVASVQRVGSSLYVNPGHLVTVRDRGRAASFAVIEIGSETVRAAIYELSGLVRQELIVERDKLV